MCLIELLDCHSSNGYVQNGSYKIAHIQQVQLNICDCIQCAYFTIHELWDFSLQQESVAFFT